MDLYRPEAYRLAGEHKGKWGMTVTLLSKFGIDEQPFHCQRFFDSEQDALRHGVKWVASRRGRVPKTVLSRVYRHTLISEMMNDIVCGDSARS